MFSNLFRLAFAALIAAAAFSPAHADLTIRLKGGKTISLPLAPEEVESISFTKGNSGTQSNAPALPATPKAVMGVTMRGGKRVLAVGPSRGLKLPSDAAKAAQDGDIIEIDAGDYPGDTAIWRQNNLTIRGVGGRPHLDAGGKSAEEKATWVIKGAATTIENIEFSGSRVGDENGAGIRQEGAGLTLNHCYFHDNQMGILSGVNPKSDIVIRNSEFANNWVDVPGSSHIGHNIYIGEVRSFTLENTYVHDAHVGHNVKSRAAHTNIIKNRIEDGKSGSASYLVDLPAGGVAVVRENSFQKGSKAENPASISYGAEKALYQANSLTVTGNHFVNDRWMGIFVDNHAPIDATITQNLFKGPGAILRGKGTASVNQVEQ